MSKTIRDLGTFPVIKMYHMTWFLVGQSWVCLEEVRASLSLLEKVTTEWLAVSLPY